MIYLAGEWWYANLLFGVTFIVAGVGIVGLGWWVLRGDRLNRDLMPTDPADENPNRVGQAPPLLDP